MIRSCEDIKTLYDFREFAEYRENAIEVGLKETASMIRWDKYTVMNPDLFDRLFEEDFRTKK